MKKKIQLYHNKRWLKRQYADKGLTCAAIAYICGCHLRTIHQWLVNLGIPRRRTGYQYLSPLERELRRLRAINSNLYRCRLGHKASVAERIRRRAYAPKGEGHWNWKGGVSPGRAIKAQSLDYRLWREFIFKRDNYTCQICGQVGRKLQAHHIIQVSVAPELLLDRDNGTTLCLRCHSHQPKHRVVLNAKG